MQMADKVCIIIWQNIVVEVGDVAIETDPEYNEDKE
jgi:hypothetical protein